MPGKPSSSSPPFAFLTTAVALVLCGIGSAQAAGPDDPGLHHEAQLLYSTQLTFDGSGVPMVTVGLMDQQELVTVTSDKGIIIAFAGEAQGQLRVPGGHALTAKVAGAKAGQSRFRVVLAGMRGGDLQALAAARKEWSTRGIKLVEIELGGIVGFPKRVLDNRRALLVEKGDFSTLAKAKQRAEQLRKRFGLDDTPRVFAEPVVKPRGTIVVTDSTASLAVRQAHMLTLKPAPGGVLEVKRVEYGRGYRHHGFADRKFHGDIVLTLDRDARLAVVNRVPAEEMLKGLVPAEIFPSSPEAALRAQAMTARGELLAKLGTRHLADPFLVCSTQHCQVYSGAGREKPRTTDAVLATRGKMIFGANGKLVDSVYSASCGGHTEHNEKVWPGHAKATLRGHADGGKAQWKAGTVPSERQLRSFLVKPGHTWCGASSKGRKVFRWQRTFPDDELDKLVNAHHGIGHVKAIEVVGRGVSGRVTQVRFVGTKGKVVVGAELKVRRLLGNLRSGMFVVDRHDGEWTFTGGGWGHGVGMCQQGAIGMGEAGKNAGQILRHYYQGSTIQKVY